VRQLALNLKTEAAARFDTFYPGPNTSVLDAVEHIAVQSGHQVQWIWGATGSGRSHLLQAAVTAAAERNARCAWLPLQGNAELTVSALEGLGALDLLCIDDVDTVAGEPDWERALFGVFEDLKSSSGRILVSASAPPVSVEFKLKDLGSRLASGPIWKLKPLDDDDLLAALQMRSRWRGLELTDEAGRYLLRRATRSIKALFEILDSADRAALAAAQSRLTVPLLKQVLN